MKRPESRARHLGSLLAVLAGSALGVGVLAGTAAASGTSTDGVSQTAQVEICKAYTTPAINENPTPTFYFSILDSSANKQFVDVTAGAGAGNFVCSEPIQVAPGVVTIHEKWAEGGGSHWWSVSSITEPVGDSYIVPGSVDLSAGTVQVDVPANNTATVEYTNDPNDGFIEVCKSAPAGTVTGNYTYNLVGRDGYTGTATTQVGSCSSPVEVPAGLVTVTEAGTNLYVTSIEASFNAAPGTASSGPGSPIVGTPNLQTGTVNVFVAPAMGSTETQTDVYYTDDVVQFKVCKQWNGADDPSSVLFPFTMTANGPSGPTAVPGSPFSLAVGDCSNPIQLRAGTMVTVTEGVVAGTKVQSIVPEGALSLSPAVAPNPDAVNRSVQVIIGQPTTSTTSSVNEGVVTFVDGPADPGSLKICVTAGTTAPSASSYDFSVSNGPSTTVPVGGCNVVGGAGTPTMFPYNSTITITGAVASPDMATAISAVPQLVTEYRGTTNEPVIVPGSVDLSAPSVQVVMSEGNTVATEVDFTIGDPPSSTTTQGSGASTSAPSSTASSSTPSAGGSSLGTPQGTSTLSPPATVSPVVSSASGSASSASATTAALLTRDRAHLSRLSHDIAVTRTSLARYHAAWHNAAVHHAKSTPKLLAEVKRLQKRLHLLLQQRNHLIAAINRL